MKYSRYRIIFVNLSGVFPKALEMYDSVIKTLFCKIVTAGGGNVVRYYKTLESLAAKLPGPREITHVFLDPGPKVIK